MDGTDSVLARFANYESRAAALGNNVSGTQNRRISSVRLTGLSGRAPLTTSGASH